MYKILLLQQHYYPEMAGVARRAKELSEQFVNNGHTVTVFTTYPREFRSMPGYDVKQSEVLNKVTVIRSNTMFNVGMFIVRSACMGSPDMSGFIGDQIDVGIGEGIGAAFDPITGGAAGIAWTLLTLFSYSYKDSLDFIA